MLAEMLAAGINANLGGRDQMPIEVEKQVLQWVRTLFNFPETASGLFVTGTSIANLIALWVARNKALGNQVRNNGLSTQTKHLVAYTSAAAHGCITQAMDLAGFGVNSLRVIPVNAQYEMDSDALLAAIKLDRQHGYTPFFIAATAGTVDVGAIDPLEAIAKIAAAENIWFHIDGAYGALGILSDEIAPRLAGIERADSIAFDFHKWGQVPYDAGFVLIRDGEQHLDTFSSPASYLRRETQGLAAGSPWPCDYGPDLSRGFRALKTWFTLKVYGTKQLGDIIANTCVLAQQMKALIEASAELELLAPVALNIVCFRYRCTEADTINGQIVIQLQNSGIAAPSTTLIDGQLAIRAAIVNHRTQASHITTLIQSVIDLGRQLTQSTASSQQ
jgi:glutamate/tyrosine decarboxylase-like PLP-dependent enzyme